MSLPLEPKDCVLDSPEFRNKLSKYETSIAGFENSLKNLSKFGESLTQVLNESNASHLRFASEIQSLSKEYEDVEGEESIFGQTLQKFSESFIEIERSREMLKTHLVEVFLKPTEALLKEEFVQLKDAKKAFEKSNDIHDSALNKYLSKRPKDSNIVEAYRELSEAKKNFHERYMDYVNKINRIGTLKKLEFMESLLGLMYGKYAFFHQGYELIKDLDPYMRDLTNQFQKLCEEYQMEMVQSKQLGDVFVQNSSYEFESQNPTSPSLISPPKTSTLRVKSGYLFLKGDQRVMQSWNRYFFKIDDDFLNYSSRSKDKDHNEKINLRLCAVKPYTNVDRRFCFELISSSRSYILQAENEYDMKEWIQCLHNAINYSFNSVHFSTSAHSTGSKDSDPIEDEDSQIQESNQSLMERLRNVPGNQKCADCGAPDPLWASINLGVLLCIECSGIHRSLGVHYSKVRSLNLDNWESEVIELMLKLGNEKVNSTFEAGIAENDDNDLVPISSKSPRIEREKWITAKYVTKKFVWTGAQNGFLVEGALNMALWNAISENDISEAFKCLILGASVDWKNDSKNGTAAIHVAVLKDDLVLLEFLLQYSCDINIADTNGRTALHYASEMNNIRIVVFLLKRGAKCTIKDCNNQTPLEVALDMAHVDVVTALRYEQSFGNSPVPHHSWNGYEDTRASFSRQRHPYSSSDLASLDSKRSSLNSGVCIEPISQRLSMDLFRSNDTCLDS
ncbi:hypothetical protein K7432_000832 [Basidiobolus ranarum]|uniref:ArfGap-domain-containing protein n=1 Tax=Basidiobolus ranarum TaxID=34480 RepID=A0ABR2X3X3_9FUNG